MAYMVSIVERVPLAPTIGGMFGVAAAVLVAATPPWLFERTIVSSGLATAPVGVAVQVVAVVVAFAVVGMAVWAAVEVVERALVMPAVPDAVAEEDELDLWNSADVIAVMPARRPIFADRELGAPLMSDEALQTVAPLVEPEEEDAMPNALRAEDPSAAAEPPTGYTSIEALIQRLEIGMARRAGPPPTDPDGSSAMPPSAAGKSWIVREDDAENGEPSTRMQRSAGG